MGMFCRAVTAGSISARPTTVSMPACTWPMRIFRTMSASPPMAPSG